MSYLSLLRRVITVGALCAVVLTGPVGAIATGGIGGRPANPDPDNPRTQSIFIMTIDKGETVKDSVLVVNNSGEKQTIRLYSVDGLVTNTGSYTCRQEADARVSLGKSIKLSKSEVTLEDGKNVEVPFTVTMPENADVGEHNGCIVFEAKDNSTDTAGGNVRVKTRQAIRVVATVPGDLKRDISIEEFSIGESADGPTYSVKLQNVGNVSADVDVVVSVDSIFGSEIYSNGGGYPVLSDSALDLTFVQEETPIFGGFYNAQTEISYSKEAGTFGTDNTDLVTKTSEKKLIYIAPTLVGGVLIFLLTASVGAGVTWFVLRQIRHKAVVGSGDKHVVKKGDTIQSVADKYGMGWKQLASSNKIKPPYTLSQGQVLHVSATKSKKQ